MDDTDNQDDNASGHYVENIRAPLADDEGLARFLLELDKKIERLNHMLANEELDENNRWVKKKDAEGNDLSPMMENNERNQYISKMHDFCSRLFTLSFYPEWNDVMRIAREARCDLGDFLSQCYYNDKLHCNIEFMRSMRNSSVRMIESSLLWALGGGMRNSIRQSARIIENRQMNKGIEDKKKFKIF
jgi:hypothetical protein